MKLWLRFLPVALAGLLVATSARAQQSPVLTVSITGITAAGGGAANENYGPAGSTILIDALAVGTFPSGGITYTFSANGQTLGTSNPNPPNGSAATIAWTPPQPGVYFISVSATDGANTANSLAVRFFATGTTITSPSEPSIVPVGSSVVIKADATVASGFIQKIDFYDGATLIGTDDSYPYSLIYTVPGAALSTHAITAIATDNTGAALTASSAVNLTLVEAIGTPPTIAINSPSDGSAIAVPTGESTIPITVTANASNADGRVTKVEIYVDGELFSTDTTFPYSVEWTPTAVGSYRLTALAYDDKNNVAASATNTIKVSAPPTVSISNPVDGSYAAADTVASMTANASDADGTIAQVDFYVNGTYVGTDSTAPYTASWTPQYRVDDNGVPLASSLTAIAKDDLGLATTSAAVLVNVTNGGGGGGAPIGNPPTTSIVTPTNPSTVALNKVTAVNAIAADSDGIVSGVQFYARVAPSGSAQSIGSTSVFPYTINWTPSVPGSYFLTSVATDSDGNQTTSAEVSVTVTGGEAPVAVITSPTAGASAAVGSAVTIAASATDADGTVSQVSFFANGLLIGTDTAAPFTATWVPSAPGTYALTAVASDNSGLQAASTTVAVIVSGVAPTVAITGPTGTVTVNTPQTITASATDSDGNVSGVQFFVNGVSIGTDLTYPYTMPWTPGAVGTVTLTAVATDNSGLQATSLGSSVTVSSGSAPSVAITYPGGGGSVPVNAATTITADATDADGTVVIVQFLVNGALLLSDVSYPFSAAWTPVTPGQYTLQAIATDNAGVQSSHAITASVTTTAPTASITAPAASAVVAVGQPSTVTATATDSDGSVASVQFFANGASLGTVLASPYTIPWTPASAGSYSLTAVVTDSSGLSVTSSAVSVSAGARPTAAVSSPADGARLPTGANTITATATDSDGTIASVDFRVDGASVGTDASSPYSVSWTATAGSHLVTVIATDNQGLQTTSAAVNVTVTGNAPTVSITAPVGAVAVNSTATVTATASDAGGTIATVQFFANGVSLGSDATYPYSVSWTPAARGTYGLTAVATDNDGLQTTSSSVSITVDDNQSPTVGAPLSSLGATPGVGLANTISVASAADADGTVAQVEFFADGVSLGVDSASPFSVSWTPRIRGTYSLTAVATDNLGATATSGATSVTVTGGNEPTVSLTAPTTGTTVAINGARTITATASPTVGTIAGVQFFVSAGGGLPVSLGVDDTFPYSISWTPTAAGSYSLTAVATDTLGNMRVSTAAAVTATAGQPPVVTIVNPNNGGTYVASKEILFDATASDPDGTITQVELLANGVVVATDTNSPYYTNWSPQSPGTYTLIARATDNSGNVADSSPVTITVTQNIPGEINLLSPASGSQFTAGGAVVFFATASDANGTINNVRFLANGDLIGSAVTTAPYTTLWTPSIPGTYTILAIAVDNDLNASTSPTRTVTITAPVGQRPSVAITAPAAGAALTTLSSVPITAGATDPDGTIASVAFYDNGVLLGSATTAPFSLAWTPATTGGHRLVAVATDNSGNIVSSAPQDFTVTASTSQPPTVSLANPGAQSAGATVNLTATAADPDGTVASVQFLVNGAALSSDDSAPFSAAWTPTQAGTYRLTAIATDSTGNQTVSSAVSVTVSAGTAPTIAIVNPLGGANITIGTPQIIAANVTPGSYAISGVQFFVNGVQIAASTAYPYGAVWTPTNLGNYVLTAVVTDSFGNRVTSADVAVTVPSAATVVSVISNNGVTAVPVGSSVILRADPAATQGVIKQVQFFDNGIALGSPVTDAPYTIIYRPQTAAGTTHVISAQATNSNGVALAMSAGLGLSVVSAVTPLPSVTIGNPLDGAKIAILSVPDSENSIAVTVNTTLTAGFVTRVELYVEGALFGSTDTYPYSFAWRPTATGTYHLVAMVYDNHGNAIASTVDANASSATPSPTTVVIAAPPVVAITSPADSGTLTGGSQMQVALVASSSNGYPLDVQLFQDDRYVGGTSLGSGGVGTVSYVPTRKTRLDGVGNIIVEPSELYAIATDPLGFTTKSLVLTNLTVSTGGSSSGSTVVGIAPTVTLTAPTASSTFAVSSPVTLAASATDTDGNISSVTFLVNNQIVNSLTAYPYTLVWTPLNLGTYAVAAKVTDNDGNTVTSSPVTVTVVDLSPGVPTVTITRPTTGTSLTAGTVTSLTATASDDVAVANVQFYVNGQPHGSLITASPYNATWTPATPGAYTLVARVTDNIGKQSTSTPVNITVTANAAPSVSLTSPATSSVVAGSTVALAATASDADGTVSTVNFLANNIVIATASAAPYTASWTAGSAGTYALVAQATDNSGNVANSTTVTLTVVANQAPTVAVTAPTNGGVLNVGTSRTITATATDADGTIASVQFLANGETIATSTSAPFRTDWTPTNEGVYRLTAVATDNAGATRTSSEVTILAVIVSAASSDTIYRGTYGGLGESGYFTAINLHGRTATFIGYSDAPAAAKTYYYADVPIDASGGFTVRDSSNKVLVTGMFSPTGVSGSLDAARLTFVGPFTFANTTTPVASGYYSGSLVGRYSSVLTGLVGLDGSITLYVKDGTFVDSGAGTVDSTGAFTITTRSGNTFTGKADPATGFLSGTLSGSTSASFAAAGSSGNTFSDGFLRNISTRGVAGTANNVLIAGFVVNGTVSKQVLVRAIGPSIGSGLTGLLADPQLQLFTSTGTAVSGGYNNDWNAGLASTFSAVGAFSLTPGSKDAAVLVTLAPGVYSAQVSGVGSTSGLALVELYDVDNQSAFSSQKMVNISTRGQVGTGNNILIAGFVVNGTSAKKVLIRGAGPALAPYITSGTLADPILRVVRVSDGATIRENDNWEVGNDATLVRDAATKVGAFAFTAGSKDAVILMTLPPGIYSAQLSGAASGTGIGLVEVYEVP